MGDIVPVTDSYYVSSQSVEKSGFYISHKRTEPLLRQREVKDKIIEEYAEITNRNSQLSKSEYIKNI